MSSTTDQEVKAIHRFMSYFRPTDPPTPAPVPPSWYDWGLSFLSGGDQPTDPPAPEISSNLVWNSLVQTFVLPAGAGAILKGCLAVTSVLYFLNQKHLLPKPLAAIVSKTLFWPTMPFTVVKRLGAWSTVVDDTVVLGAAPLGIVNFPEKLYKEHNVRGVVNMCSEFRGPERQYKKLGIRHLWLPTVDHFEPSVADLERGVAFIKKHQEKGSKVYVHCKAGHGRSAAVVFAWLIYTNPKVDLRELNMEFCQLRSVRKGLWQQTNILEFQARLQRGEIELTEWPSPNDDDGYSDKEL